MAKVGKVCWEGESRREGGREGGRKEGRKREGGMELGKKEGEIQWPSHVCVCMDTNEMFNTGREGGRQRGRCRDTSYLFCYCAHAHTSDSGMSGPTWLYCYKTSAW